MTVVKIMPAEVEIQSFSKKSFAKFFSVLHLIIGLLAGILMMIIGIIDAATLPIEESGMTMSQALINGFIMITIAPMAYAIFGGLFGWILALIYNISVKYTGGIRFSPKH